MLGSSSFKKRRSAPGDGIAADLRRDQTGAAAVEFTLIAPLLAMLIVLSADIGMGVFSKMQVEEAAQAGAQYAILHGFDSSSIAGAVTNATSNSLIIASPLPTQFCGCPKPAGITATACGAVCSNGNSPGTYVTVTAQGTYSTLINYSIVPSSYTFNAQSTVRLK